MGRDPMEEPPPSRPPNIAIYNAIADIPRDQELCEPPNNLLRDALG